MAPRHGSGADSVPEAQVPGKREDGEEESLSDRVSEPVHQGNRLNSEGDGKTEAQRAAGRVHRAVQRQGFHRLAHASAGQGILVDRGRHPQVAGADRDLGREPVHEEAIPRFHPDARFPDADDLRQRHQLPQADTGDTGLWKHGTVQPGVGLLLRN